MAVEEDEIEICKGFDGDVGIPEVAIINSVNKHAKSFDGGSFGSGKDVDDAAPVRVAATVAFVVVVMLHHHPLRTPLRVIVLHEVFGRFYGTHKRSSVAGGDGVVAVEVYLGLGAGLGRTDFYADGLAGFEVE